MTGFECHRGEIARVFVLTESDEAIENGYNFNLKFQRLIENLRKFYGRNFEYCCVIHRQGDKKRINAHVVYFGDWIDQQVIEDYWFKNYGSHRSKMQKVNDPLKQARYLAKYLKSEDFIKARFSYGWVFSDWWGFSQWIKKQWGQYPDNDMLAKLSKMSKEELLNDVWYGLYTDEKIKAGKLKPKVTKPEAITKKMPLLQRLIKSGKFRLISTQAV
jgi:hypothetical protein